MKDILFYCETVDTNRLRLPEEEVRHAVTVLRHRVGDELQCTDGKGNIYTGRLISAGRREALLDIVDMRVYDRPPETLTIAIAPTKSFDRTAWCLEKLTEIGVDIIAPVHC